MNELRVCECWYRSVCSEAPAGCTPTCVRFAEMLDLMQTSNLPRHRWFPTALVPEDADLNAFLRLRDIKDDIVSWVQEGNSLYLYSTNFGNGKTSWAVKLMLAYFNRIWCGNCFRCRGVFVSVPELFDRERLRISGDDSQFVDIRNQLLTTDLVIWDDVSAVRLTDYNASLLFNLIDARLASGKANIYTSNVDEERLAEHVGGHLASRIWEESEAIELVGTSRRSKKNG